MDVNGVDEPTNITGGPPSLNVSAIDILGPGNGHKKVFLSNTQQMMTIADG